MARIDYIPDDPVPAAPAAAPVPSGPAPMATAPAVLDELFELFTREGVVLNMPGSRMALWGTPDAAARTKATLAASGERVNADAVVSDAPANVQRVRFALVTDGSACWFEVSGGGRIDPSSPADLAVSLLDRVRYVVQQRLEQLG